MFAMRRTVLSVSLHTATQITWNLILERAGYKVISTGDPGEAVQMITGNRVHALVLGDSISAENRQQLCTSLKRLNPRVPIVMLCKTNDSRALRDLADEQVESFEDPQLLLDALERVVY